MRQQGSATDVILRPAEQNNPSDIVVQNESTITYFLARLQFAIPIKSASILQVQAVHVGRCVSAKSGTFDKSAARFSAGSPAHWPLGFKSY